MLDLDRRDRPTANNADVSRSMSGPHLAGYRKEVTARQALADGAAHVLIRGTGDCPCRVEETTGAGNEGAGLREKLSVRETADLRLSKEQTLFVRVIPHVARRQSKHGNPQWMARPTHLGAV